jgi:hypothetical protein
MSHYVTLVEADNADPLNPLQLIECNVQAGSHSIRQVDLAEIAGNGHACPLPHTSQGLASLANSLATVGRAKQQPGGTVPLTDCSQSVACLSRTPGAPSFSGLNVLPTVERVFSRGGRREQAGDTSADAGFDRSRRAPYAVMRGHR